MKNIVWIIVLLLGACAVAYLAIDFGHINSSDEAKDKVNGEKITPTQQQTISLEPITSNELKLSLIAASESDQRAVVEGANGISHVLSVGDLLVNTNLKLVQVSGDKLVLRDGSDQDLYFLNKKLNGQSSQLVRLSSDVTLHQPPPIQKPIIN